MKTILVTGAAGFIGCHVSEALLERGDRVVGIDELNAYYPVRLKAQNLARLRTYERFVFFQRDIVRLDDLVEVFKSEQITHVAHLAARAGVRPSIADPFIYQQANVQGTLNLLDLSRKFEVQNFVLTSSSSVYGNSTSVPFREEDSQTDRPISPYAATKKATELLGYTYHHLYGLPVNVIRPFTVYGPRGRPDMAPWIFLESALLGKPIRKFGDGETRRDYTYVGDFVRGFVNAIDRPLGYEIFNLGNSATVSLNEAIAIVEKVSGKTLEVVQEPMQPGDVSLTNADISKAKRLLDYNPTTDFHSGMKLFAEWYLANVASARETAPPRQPLLSAQEQ